MLDAFIPSITFTSQGLWKVVFFLKRKKEILGEFLVALQYDCTQITTLMLPVINRKFLKKQSPVLVILTTYQLKRS